MAFHLKKLFNTKSGRYIMSAILGFGLATLFRFACKDDKCIVFKSPPAEEVKGSLYKHDGKCYEYEAHAVRCDKENKKIVSV